MSTKEDSYLKDKSSIIIQSRNLLNLAQSLCVKTCSVCVNYLAGIFDISPCLLVGLFLLVIYRDHRRMENKFRQQVAMAISLRNESKMVLINLNQPSWVYFSEIENCEWLNTILHNVWPKIDRYTEKILKHTVEPRLNKVMSAYKNNPDFKFQTLRLGSIVPRLYGLKVYKYTSRCFQNIVLDIRLFYAGDAEIYFYLLSLGGGVKNLEISGKIRVIFKIHVDPIPLLGGIEIFFLHKPKVDFDFTGAMDVLKIPGISGMLRKTLDDQLSLLMVLPNKITLKMNDIVESGYWKCPDPEGLVRIHVIEAKDLNHNNSSYFGPGSPDTCVEVSFGSQKFFSDYFEGSVNPKWLFRTNFMVDSSFEDYFLINVTERSSNQSLGKASIELILVKDKKLIQRWIQLEEAISGMIYLEIIYSKLSYSPLDVDLLSYKLSYALVVFINTAFNLVNPRSNSIPNCFVHLEIGKHIRVSKSVLSNNPIFEEVILFVFGGDVKNSKLKLKLVDANTKTDLGYATLPLKRVFGSNYMEIMDQTCPLLNSVTESSLSLSMRLRVLKQ